VFGNEEVNGVYPTDWSPDGQWIAVVLERKDRSKQIGLVRAQDGSYRGLRTVGWHGPAKIFFSPDGKFLVYDLPAGDKVNQRDIFMIALDGSKETRVIEHPGQDIVIGWSAIGRELLFASDRNGQKGLWAVPVSDGRPTGDPVLLKPDIGAASSLGLTSSGVLHLMKDASTTRLQMVPIDLAKGKVVGAPVVENYVNNARPDWSRDGKYIAYASIGSSGVRTLFIRSLQSGELRELRPPLDYYNWPRWMPDGKSLLMFARDLTGRSGIYRVDARNGDTSLVINNESFTRVQVSPDGTKIYYNVDAHGPSPGPAKYVERDLNSGNTRILFEGPKGKTGHVELSPDGEHLALIVQGDDGSAVILVPVSGGEPRELYKSKSFPGRGLRGFGGLSWTPGSSAILVAGNAGFWLISLKDRKPRRLDIDLNVSEFRLAPDGRHIATNAGESLREIWALENFLPTQTASNK
jgi:Tol biopolymer transport system component